MTQIDPKAAEEYVRARWKQVWVSDWYADKNYAVEAWTIQLPCRWSSSVGNSKDDPDMWLVAYQFTLTREKEIAMKEEEIALLHEAFDWSHPDNNYTALAAKQYAIFQRILSVLQEQLTELKRGWRG